MSLNLTGKNLAITPALKNHVEVKFESLNQRYSDITNSHVVLHIEHLDHIAEATAHFHGQELHATAKSEDMYTAIDQMIDKLAGQMQKQKEKTIDSHRQTS